MQCIGQGGVEQPPARRQIGHCDAQAHACVDRYLQPPPGPGRGGATFGFRLGAFDAARRRGCTGTEVDAKQFDPALFQRQQQARDQRVGQDEAGQPDARRQAAQPAFDAGDAPGQGLVHAAPAAGAAGGIDVVAPALKGRVFGIVQSLGDLDAPVALQARRPYRRQRQAFAIEQPGRGAGVARDGQLPEIALLHMAKEAAGGRFRRDIAAQQGARHQRVQPQRRRRALQGAPGRRAAHHLCLAMGAPQVDGQPRRGAEYHRLRPAGQVGERHDRQIGTDHAVATPPAAASARPGRRGQW